MLENLIVCQRHPACNQKRPQRFSDLHALVNHLAEVEGLVGELRPASVQDYLKDGTHQPPSRLWEQRAALSAWLGSSQ